MTSTRGAEVASIELHLSLLGRNISRFACLMKGKERFEEDFTSEQNSESEKGRTLEVNIERERERGRERERELMNVE